MTNLLLGCLERLQTAGCQNLRVFHFAPLVRITGRNNPDRAHKICSASFPNLTTTQRLNEHFLFEMEAKAPWAFSARMVHRLQADLGATGLEFDKNGRIMGRLPGESHESAVRDGCQFDYDVYYFEFQ